MKKTTSMTWLHILVAVVAVLLGGVLKGQTYTVGDTVGNFNLEICENGDGTWEYHQDGVGNVVWMNLFTSW
jgi:membrane protein YqaA with SNARE-associated domain